ncbi:MAG: hypothetical protein LBS62_01095, partial [Clostridiales bacterium]|nr:hypothetical protein [Clostridiales bacterium]
MASVTADDVLMLIKKSLEESDERFTRRLDESGKEFTRRLDESTRRLDESDERFTRRLDESGKEFDRRLEESDSRFMRNLEESSRRAEREMKELSKQIGGLGNRFGDWAEAYFNKRTIDKFCELGYKFTKSGRLEFKDDSGDCFAEADIWMENGEYVMVVEVKSDLQKKHIDEHLERIHKIREYMD